MRVWDVWAVCWVLWGLICVIGCVSRGLLCVLGAHERAKLARTILARLLVEGRRLQARLAAALEGLQLERRLLSRERCVDEGGVPSDAA